jgi:hypothetical protein
MAIPYQKGVKNTDGSWKIRPVHYILFFSVRMSFFETHHLYWGIIATYLGFEMLFSSVFLLPVFGFYVTGLGIWTAIDDLYQHNRQVYEYDPLYHSPIHKWYGTTLWSFGWIRALNKFSDWVFGLFK